MLTFIFETDFGRMAIAWEGKGEALRVKRIYLPRKAKDLQHELQKENHELSSEVPKKIQKIIRDLQKYFQGEAVDFSYVPLDLSKVSSFEKSVFSHERKLPRGKVVSYQRLAAEAGNPKASRAVGNLQAKNPFPIVIPCHRVVRSDFRIGHFQTGQMMKERLLELEGVSLSKKKDETYVLPV